jgi:hypothetical protein
VSKLDPERLSALGRALDREANAALGLTRLLRRARAAAEHLDPSGLDAALSAAGSALEALAREASTRSRLTAETARLVGLPADAPLAQLVAALGTTGTSLDGAADELARRLEALVRESTALGICTRYGAAVTRHLSGLAATRASYGPEGRFAGPLRTAERRV